MLEISNHSSDIKGDYKTAIDDNLNMCLENSNLIKTNSSASSNTAVNLDSNNVKENSCYNKVDNQLKNERHDVINGEKKRAALEVSKDRKSKYGASFSSKSTYHNKHMKHPLSKRKFVPVASHLTNASAKVVLFERNVEIKDLESKVKYLQNKIKELENENKTLQGVQSRQGRELKKFKEGVADIPSLLRSHKEETKVYESALSNVRRELRDCQKDMKVKNEVLLRKESQIDKLNVTVKRYEKNNQDLASELREFKATKKDLEEENKMLLGANENLKSENENLQKKIKSMEQQMQSLEENFMKVRNQNQRSKDDLTVLQKKYDDMQLKVSSKGDASSPDKPVNSIPQKDDVCEVLTEVVLSENNVKSESTESSNLLSEEIKEKVEEKEVCTDNKAKDVLIHTLKRYQDLCSTKQNNCSTKTCEIVTSNLKLLPPLKQPYRKKTQHTQSDLVSKESFPSSADLTSRHENMQWQSEELATYFRNKVKTNEAPKAESKHLVTKKDKNNSFCEIPKTNSSQAYLQLSAFDNW